MAAAGPRIAPAWAGVVDAALSSYLATFREPKWQTYLATHHRRYRILIGLLVDLLAKLPPTDSGEYRLLDIGPRFEVDLLHRVAGDVRVDTLGLIPGLFPPRDGERHVAFDLNDSDLEAQRPTLGPYQLIVMAEVLEHLHLPPPAVLGWVSSLLGPGGYLLLQTPNAVALPKRLRMLAGTHPFAPLNADRVYPGHIREYTIAELVREGQAIGLEAVDVRTANYFDSEKRSNRIYQRLERLVPSGLRAGITVVYRAPSPRSA